MNNAPKILSYNSWDPLEEVLLGDVWPTSFYDDLDPKIRDSFCQVTEWTKEDLNVIQNKLQEFGITVRRPVIDESNKNLYINPKIGKLYKPPICPRDSGIAIGDKLYWGEDGQTRPWTDLIKQTYSPDSVIKNHELRGSDIVRYGKDIIFDQNIEHSLDPNATDDIKARTLYKYHRFLTNTLKYFGNDHRCHFITNGGHTDACFAILKPGLLMTTKYFSDYDLFFPGWEKIYLREPTYSGRYPTANKPMNPAKWNFAGPGIYGSFSDYIEKFCPDWVGEFTETYFEVNVLMLDEKNMLCIGSNPDLFKKLEQNGITCHIVPFRTKTFWDGGIHCVTLDIRRKSVLQDYFPEKGPVGVGHTLSQLGDQLDAEYNKSKNK